MATIKILDNHSELNDCGCSFFINTSEAHITRLTSSELRWLSVRTGTGEYISKNQQIACRHIESIAQKYGSKEWDKVNMKILLYKNPVTTQHTHIKMLLKCGADIRYLKGQNNIRIVVQDNILYFTISPSIEKVVNSGVVYTGKKINDPLIDYYVKIFDEKFNKARQIELSDKNKIKFKSIGLSYWYDVIKNLDIKDWINLILGAIIGAIISVLGTLISNN